MSRFISFVFADLGYESREGSENYKMLKILPTAGFDPTISGVQYWRLNVPFWL